MIRYINIGATPKQNLNTPEEVISYLNEMTGRKFKLKTKSHLDMINTLLNRGYCYPEIVLVINFMVKKWKNIDAMKKHLRPQIIFTVYNFKKNLNELRGIQTNEFKIINQQKPAI